MRILLHELLQRFAGTPYEVPSGTVFYRGAKVVKPDTRAVHLEQRRFFSLDRLYAGDYCYWRGLAEDDRVLFKVTLNRAIRLVPLQSYNLIHEGLLSGALPKRVFDDPVAFQIKELPELACQALGCTADGIADPIDLYELLLLHPKEVGDFETFDMPETKSEWRNAGYPPAASTA